MAQCTSTVVVQGSFSLSAAVSEKMLFLQFPPVGFLKRHQPEHRKNMLETDVTKDFPSPIYDAAVKGFDLLRQHRPTRSQISLQPYCKTSTVIVSIYSVVVLK